MNSQWHAANRLPRSANFETRLEWHRDHAENCGCREPPADIRRELERRGMLPPPGSGGEARDRPSA
jgi:hypothetical protein